MEGCWVKVYKVKVQTLLGVIYNTTLASNTSFCEYSSHILGYTYIASLGIAWVHLIVQCTLSIDFTYGPEKYGTDKFVQNPEFCFVRGREATFPNFLCC
jgi:hypothetical protein